MCFRIVVQQLPLLSAALLSVRSVVVVEYTLNCPRCLRSGLRCTGAVACTLFCFCCVCLCVVAKANVSANEWVLYALSLRLQVSMSAYNFIFKLHQIQTCQNYYKCYSNVCCNSENQIAVTNKGKRYENEFNCYCSDGVEFYSA